MRNLLLNFKNKLNYSCLFKSNSYLCLIINNNNKKKHYEKL